jgi:hypothetical protein
MKYRVLFLKRKHIYITIIFIIIVILFLVFLSLKRTSETFSVITDNKIIKGDLTGDGQEDILYIKTDNNKYSLQVNTKDQSLFLEPDKKLNTLGTYSQYWPMRVKLSDLTRDKVPEIFVQASQKDSPIMHIFTYNSGKFNDIFSSSNNILGLLDSHNNRTPKLICGNLAGDGVNFSSYMMLSNKIESYGYNYSTDFMGKATMLTFIRYIEGLPANEAEKPKDIFSDNMNGADLSIIGKMAGSNNVYKFQDALFTDNKWDKKGNISEISWTVSFKATSTIKSGVKNNYTLNIGLKPVTSKNDTTYRIFSMEIK